MINIRDKKDCVGCYACYNRCPKKCIAMKPDSEGFFYPEVDLKNCVNCGLCEEVCPVLRPPKKRPVRKCYGVINKDDIVRMESSSGGTFSLLGEEILHSGGVVFGAAFDEKFDVQHIGIETIEELKKLRGSKYVQSKIDKIFKKAKEELINGKNVLFSGTPCQIAGFRRYVGKEYDNLYLVDVVCHGVPSPKAYREMLKFSKERIKEDITSVNFRDKETGWKNSSVVIKGKFKVVRSIKQENIYMKAFLKNMSTRPSCYVCRYNNEHSSSDLTIADYWGVETKFPEVDDNKGVTLVLVNTIKGAQLFKKISEKAQVVETDFLHASEYNFAVSNVSTPHLNRQKFFDKLGKMPFEELVKILI